jgi:hypothetical protein
LTNLNCRHVSDGTPNVLLSIDSSEISYRLVPFPGTAGVSVFLVDTGTPWDGGKPYVLVGYLEGLYPFNNGALPNPLPNGAPAGLPPIVETP